MGILPTQISPTMHFPVVLQGREEDRDVVAVHGGDLVPPPIPEPLGVPPA